MSVLHGAREVAPGPPEDVALVPVDPADAAAFEAWVLCASRVFTSPPPNEEQLEARRILFAGHRLTAARDGEATVATFRSYQRGLDVPGGHVQANAISSVTVLPTHRRRRLLTRWMLQDLRRAAQVGTPASILIASEAPIYGRFGFGTATRSCTWTVDARSARFPQPPAGRVQIVEPEVFAAAAPPVYERARRRQPGAIDRGGLWWETISQLRTGMREHDRLRLYAVHRGAGDDVDGTLAYRVHQAERDRVSDGRLEVVDLVAATDGAYADLWRYCCDVDFVTRVQADDRSPDEPLPWLLADPRAARCGPVSDFLWVRLHDVPAALAARRYPVADRLVVEVEDPLADEVGGTVRGRWALEVGPDGSASCRPTEAEPDLRLAADTLASLWLGGVGPGALQRAGRLRTRDGAVLGRVEALFSWPDPAWCGTWF